jgi:hypothetical protein
MRAILFALATLACSTLWATDNYFYLSDHETSLAFPGDVIRFFGRDTLWGPVHSNDWIATQNVGGLPVAYDVISTTRPGFRPGSPNPAFRFLDGDPIFDADYVWIPETLPYFRETAALQNHFLHVPGHEWYCSVFDSRARFYHWEIGMPMDTLTAESVEFPLADFDARFFVDGQLSLRGELATDGCQFVVGTSGDIFLLDNVMLRNTNPANGALPAGATSRIVIASEQGIYVANTPENGREDCGGNHSVPNQSRCHIVVTAFLFALGTTFQIEQMNDINDPYQGPNPDERGNLVLTGGLTNRNRGYLHRSNQGGTGYNKVFHYDERLRHWRINVLEHYAGPNDDFTDTQDHLFPEQFLLNVAPNPFNASTSIRFTLPNSESVKAKVFDIQGRKVAQLTSQTYSAGDHVLHFDGTAFSSGVYFLSFQAGDQLSTHKLLLLK